MVNCLFENIETGEIVILETDDAVNLVNDKRIAVYYRENITYVCEACQFHRKFKPYAGGRNGDIKKC